MHIAETFTPLDTIPATKIITMEGEGQSGKGTSAAALQHYLTESGVPPIVIDQGHKFRVMTRLALQQPNADSLLSDQSRLGDFLMDGETRESALNMLDDMKNLNDIELRAVLRTPDIQTWVKEVGGNPNAHGFAVGVMMDQVRSGVSAGVDTVIIDGRGLHKYGVQIAKERLAQYALGFYFQCDSAIAGRRNMGHITDPSLLDDADKLALFDQIIMINNRNRDDTLRDTDPMLPVHGAYMLDPYSFNSSDEEFVRRQTLAALRSGAVLLNTSYTKDVKEMTDPVVAMAVDALKLYDEELERFQQNPKLWDSHLPFDDPEASHVIAGFSDFDVATS